MFSYYIKAHVLMYFLHLVLTFIPHYIIMVKGLFLTNPDITVTCYNAGKFCICMASIPHIMGRVEKYLPEFFYIF